MSRPECPNLVARVTWSRRPRSASPMSVSDSPGSLPYMSAVSRNVTPASIAASSTSRVPSSVSVLACPRGRSCCSRGRRRRRGGRTRRRGAAEQVEVMRPRYPARDGRRGHRRTRGAPDRPLGGGSAAVIRSTTASRRAVGGCRECSASAPAARGRRLGGRRLGRRRGPGRLRRAETRAAPQPQAAPERSGGRRAGAGASAAAAVSRQAAGAVAGGRRLRRRCMPAGGW